MQVYTSYWGRAKKLKENGIEPIAICRGLPEFFRGQSFPDLAPKWNMMNLRGQEFNDAYINGVLAYLDPNWVYQDLEQFGFKEIALMCYEKNPLDCHRSVVAGWLTAAGYDVEEWEPPVKQSAFGPLTGQMALF